MLARRAFSRSLSYLRYDGLISDRLILRSHFHVRPVTLSGRIWYRPDGTPRSRLKGLAIATITSGTLFAMYSALVLIDEFDTANYLLSCLIQIQRIDTEISSVDFSNYESTHAYFLELCTALFGDVPQDMIDDFFNDVYNLTGSLKMEAHRILKDACVQVHEILVGSKRMNAWETAVKVVRRLDEGLVELVEIIEETHSEGGVKVLMHQKIKEKATKDPGTRSGEYEVVG